MFLGAEVAELLRRGSSERRKKIILNHQERSKWKMEVHSMAGKLERKDIFQGPEGTQKMWEKVSEKVLS